MKYTIALVLVVLALSATAYSARASSPVELSGEINLQKGFVRYSSEPYSGPQRVVIQRCWLDNVVSESDGMIDRDYGSVAAAFWTQSGSTCEVWVAEKRHPSIALSDVLTFVMP